MNSWLVTMVLLASAGAQVPITSYTCTQPNLPGFLDHGRCTVSGELRTCTIKEGVRPALLNSSLTPGLYAWDSSIPLNTNPFVVLNIPQGWCVGSVRMTFVAPSSIPVLSLSVHSAERLSTNTDRTMFSLVSEAGTTPVVMNLTTLARGKYLRINMTWTGRLYLNEIEVFGTNDSICTHPSSAGGDPATPTTPVTPASPTTSFTPATPTTSVTPASSTTSVTPASPTTSTTPASPTTSVTPASPTNSATPVRAQVPITSYTCTQPNIAVFLDHRQCTFSGGLRMCAIKEVARPVLLSSSVNLGVYAWKVKTNPFVVLDIPQGWCVESVKMTFRAPGSIPTLSISVHSAERLSTNTDRTMFSIVSEEGTTPVVMNLTALALGRYLRINMTSTGRLYLGEIEVFGTNDSICTHPSSACGDPASPATSVTPASPNATTSVGSSTYSVTPTRTSDYSASSGPSSTPSQSSTIHISASSTIFTSSSLPSARPTTSVHSSSFTTTPMSSQPRTSANATSGHSSTPFQSFTIHSGTSFTIFTPSASTSPALSARPTTTSVHSSSSTTTPMSSQPSTSDNSTTSGPSSTPSQSPTIQPGSSFTVSALSVTPSPSPSPTPGGVPVAPDSYVLPAAISAAAVLLAVVLTAIFVVVICIITRRHKTRKSLDVQRLSSVIYRSTQSDVTFKDNQFHTGKNGEVPIHSANGAVDKDHSGEIWETPCSYTDLGPSESNDSVLHGAAEEPMAEGAISRPTSQTSIHSNEVIFKPAHGMVTWVNPSMLNFQNCNWENTTAGTEESGHYETSPHWQHAGGAYNLHRQLPGEGAATDDRRRGLKDAKAQVGTTHQPPAQAPPTALPIVESAYADTLAEVQDKKREPSPISPTYASVDPPSSFPTPATTHQSKHSSRPEPSPSAKNPRVPQEDHVYSEVDKSRKKSASSTTSLPPRLSHRADGTHDCTTHQPPPQDPPWALPIVADIAYADTPVASEKKREPSTSSPTYANIDNQLHTGQSADVSIHDEKAAVDTNHNIRDAPRNYAAMAPSESNDSVFQGAATEEPVTEGAISRPTSQASIRSNEVSSKPTLGMFSQVHPRMLDRPYDRSNWENTMAGTDESGHYETSLYWQHAGGAYYNLSNCQLPGEDDKHRVVKDAKTQVGTTHQPPPQDPPSVLPTAESAYANAPVASDKRREPSTSGPTYANIDPPSSSSTLAAAQPSKQHSSCPNPLPSAERPRVPQKDHIDKTSASSTYSPPAHLTHIADYTEVDADFRGGSGNVEEDSMAQPQSITSSTTAKRAVPTQEGHIYAAVDYSKKKSRRVKES